MDTWRRLILPLSTPSSSSIYHSHPPLPLPSLLLLLLPLPSLLLLFMIAFNIDSMSCIKLVSAIIIIIIILFIIMLDGRSIARDGEGGLAGCRLSYRVVVLPEKQWRGGEEEEEDRNSIRWTGAVWLCLQAKHAYCDHRWLHVYHITVDNLAITIVLIVSSS